MDLFILFQEACNIWWNHANLLCPGFQLKFWKKKKNISGLKNKYRMIFFVFCSYYWFSFHLQFYFYCVNWMQGWFIAGMWYNWFEDFFSFRISDFSIFINAGLYSLGFMLTVHIVTSPVFLITVYIAVIKMVINHVEFNIRQIL